MKGLKVSVLLAMLAATACNHGEGSYSILSDDQVFHQNSATQDTKIDVLWVIDNSGSMATSQQNLADNFNSFISEFSKSGYDFQLAITTTQAFLANPIWTPFYNTIPMPTYFDGLAQDLIAKFRDGTAGGSHSGYFVLTPNTPNLEQNFVINALQGINGYGDERSFESLEAALTSPHNSGFVRPNGFLAVVILTDEDDFSSGTTKRYETYDKPLVPVEHYVSLLDGLTNSTPNNRHYNVNTIAVPDQACLDQIFNGAQKIGLRVNQLADATGGKKGNICGDFAEELKLISKKIVELSTQFSLGSVLPVPETIRIWINGMSVPDSESNPNHNGGWTYNAQANSIMFQGEWVPPQGAVIQVAFDPVSVTF